MRIQQASIIIPFRRLPSLRVIRALMIGAKRIVTGMSSSVFNSFKNLGRKGSSDNLFSPKRKQAVSFNKRNGVSTTLPAYGNSLTMP